MKRSNELNSLSLPFLEGVIEEYLSISIHQFKTLHTSYHTFPEYFVELNDESRVGVVIIEVEEPEGLFNEIQTFIDKLFEDSTIAFPSFLFICIFDSEVPIETIMKDYSKIYKLIISSNYIIDVNIGFVKQGHFRLIL